jgi:hypothetical protein
MNWMAVAKFKEHLLSRYLHRRIAENHQNPQME